MSQIQTTIPVKSDTAPNNELSHTEFNELNSVINANSTDTETRLSDIETTPIKSYTSSTLPAISTDGTIAFDTTLNTHVYFKGGVWYRLDNDNLVSDQIIDIFILAGQSNAHGHAQVSDLSIPQSSQDAFFYTSWHDNTSNAETTQYFSNWVPTAIAGSTRGDSGSTMVGGSAAFGPELGFISRANVINLTDRPMGILKYAVGASSLIAGNPSLSDWDLTATGSREGDCWRGFQVALADGLSKLAGQGYTYNLKGLIWWQGESGTSVTDLNAFIAEVRNLVGSSYGVSTPSEFPVVITGTSTGWGQTLAAGVADADPYVGFVNSELHGQYNVGGPYNTHIGSGENGISTDLNTNGINDMFDIGESYADEMILAINGNTNVPWDVSSITTQLWLDMDDSSTITESVGVVSSILDKSGNNYNFTGNGTVEVATAIQNGKNALQFTSSSDTLTSSIPFPTTTQRWYFVFNPVVDSSVDPAFQILKSVSGTVYQQVLFAQGSPLEFAGKWYSHPIGNGQTSSIPNHPYSPTDLSNDWNMYEVEWNVDDSTFTILLNGNIISADIPWGGSFPAQGNYGVTINGATSGQKLDGFHGELIVTDDLVNQEKIQGYLAWKWGLESKLPIGHTYKTIAP